MHAFMGFGSLNSRPNSIALKGWRHMGTKQDMYSPKHLELLIAPLRTFIFVCDVCSAAKDTVKFLKTGGGIVSWSCNTDCKGWEGGHTCEMTLTSLYKKKLTGPIPAIGLLTCKDQITLMYRAISTAWLIFRKDGCRISGESGSGACCAVF